MSKKRHCNLQYGRYRMSLWDWFNDPVTHFFNWSSCVKSIHLLNYSKTTTIYYYIVFLYMSCLSHGHFWIKISELKIWTFFKNLMSLNIVINSGSIGYLSVTQKRKCKGIKQIKFGLILLYVDSRFLIFCVITTYSRDQSSFLTSF